LAKSPQILRGHFNEITSRAADFAKIGKEKALFAKMTLNACAATVRALICLHDRKPFFSEG
jgi:hypothetical protein